jgi:hypothetical protein
MKFSHILRTKATPEKIWNVWTNVDKWKQWDYNLEYSKLNGKFAEGATGFLKSRRGPESRFVIDLVAKHLLVVVIDIPFSKLRITRRIYPQKSGCKFSHETSFEGPVGFVYGLLLGKRFRRELPIVMGKVKKIAESK